MRSILSTMSGRACVAAVTCTAATVLGVLGLAGAGAGAPGGTVSLDEKRAEVRAVEAELADVDGRQAAAGREYEEATRRLAAAQDEIAANTAAIKQARRDRTRAVALLERRLVDLYRSEMPSFATIVLTSDDLAEALEAYDALQRVSAHDQRVARATVETRMRLIASRRALAAERATAGRQVGIARARVAQMRRLVGQRRAVLTQARSVLSGLEAAQAARVAAAQRSIERSVAQTSRTLPTSASAAVTPPAQPDAPSSAGAGGASAHLERIAMCESGGNPRAVSANGLYRGKYQFAVETWRALGGSGDPAAASEAEQDRIAALLYARSGAAPWPVCGS